MGKDKGSRAETEANDLGSRQKANRSRSAGEVGEGQGSEEEIGGLGPAEPAVARYAYNSLLELRVCGCVIAPMLAFTGHSGLRYQDQARWGYNSAVFEVNRRLQLDCFSAACVGRASGE